MVSATITSISLMRRRPAVGSWVMPPILLHAGDEAVDFRTHFVRRHRAETPSMPRQHPLEAEITELLHRARLLAPRIPAHRARCAQRTVGAPPQMVAGEEHAI